jgi:N-acetylglucosamine kinase-like BadF-type ATPase
MLMQEDFRRSTTGGPPSSLVIGVDGGGTRTRAWLANRQGDLLGNGEAGIANPNARGFAAAQNEILAAIERAFQNAHLEKQMVAAVCLGIGGVDRTDERTRFTEWAQQTLAPRAQIVNDGEIVLAAGLPENWGVALIAGTGSIAWGKARDGRIARAGGWGYLIGDEGSGFELAREALRAAVQASDGRGDPTRLLEMILNYWELNSAMELVPRVYRSGLAPADIARLAPLVVRAAEEEDTVARRLLERTATALADTVIGVSRVLELRDEKIPLALAGGLLLETESLRKSLHADLIRRGDAFFPIVLVREPVIGAVRLAVELAQSR